MIYGVVLRYVSLAALSSTIFFSLPILRTFFFFLLAFVVVRLRNGEHAGLERGEKKALCTFGAYFVRCDCRIVAYSFRIVLPLGVEIPIG